MTTTITNREERQAAFKEALEMGKYIEYRCKIYGEVHVRNTRAGYCKLMTKNEVKAELINNECFRNCFDSEKENPSKLFDYYFDTETDEYFACEK